MTTATDHARVTHPLVAAVAVISASVDDLLARRARSMELPDCHEASRSRRG